MMTALGSAVSPQACRQARINRSSSRRHRPSQVHRANSVYSVPNGMSHSWPMARHCMPQKQTHQIAMIALRSAAPVNGGFGPVRVRRVPSAAMAASSARDVLAGVKGGDLVSFAGRRRSWRSELGYAGTCCRMRWVARARGRCPGCSAGPRDSPRTRWRAWSRFSAG